MAAMSYMRPRQPFSLTQALSSSSSGSAPSIDLNWEPFQQHVESFLFAIDAYVMSAKGYLVTDYSQYTSEVRRCNVDKEEAEKRIQHERTKEGHMLETLDAERKMLADLSASLQSVQANLAKTREQSNALEAELNAIKRDVKAQTSEKDRQKRKLDEMRSIDTEELKTLQKVTGWQIDGIRKDVLLMRFTLVDPADPDREFAFVLDFSKDEYEVPKCSPVILNLAELLRQVNTDRQVFDFIKRMRRAFCDHVAQQPKPPSKFDDLAGPGLRTPGPKTTLRAAI